VSDGKDENTFLIEATDSSKPLLSLSRKKKDPGVTNNKMALHTIPFHWQEFDTFSMTTS